MAFNVYRNGLHVAYCQKKDLLKEWFENESGGNTFETNEVD